MTNNTTNMRSKKIIWPGMKYFKSVVKIMIPLIIGQMIITSVTFVDNFIIGHTADNKTNLAAVAIANEMWFFLFGIIMAISITSSIFMAQYFGAGKIDELKKIQKNLIGMSLIVVGIIAAIVIIFPNKFLSIYTHDEAIKRQAAKYARWVFADLLFIAVSYPLQTSFNVIGKTRYVMISAGVALVNNCVMGYLFIYPLDMGAEGAGIANFISRGFEIMIMMFFAYKNREFVTTSFKVFMFDLKTIKMILSKWFFTIATMCFVLSMVALTAVWTNNYDKEVVSAVGIGYAVSNIMWTIFPAISASNKVFVGRELGKGNFDKALENSRKLNSSIMFIALFFSVAGIAVSFFLPQVVGLNGEAADIARDMILIYAGANIFYVFASVLFSSLEAGGVTLPSTIFSNFFQIAITLPIALLVATFSDLPFWSVFLIAQATQVIPAGFAYFFYHQFKWLKSIAN